MDEKEELMSPGLVYPFCAFFYSLFEPKEGDNTSSFQNNMSSCSVDMLLRPSPVQGSFVEMTFYV